ncbi:hypothetical protein DL771_000766 [Monosporascus sp. 5C6A]|nr:hypothetical protein DL771_000766 [Monosporascus sp. 5C6A]
MRDTERGCGDQTLGLRTVSVNYYTHRDGSADDSIVKQIRAENPQYPFRNRTTFPITSDDSTKSCDTGIGRSDTTGAVRSDGAHNARDNNVFCGVGGDGWADQEAIAEPITYLRDLTGACYAFPGPGFCGRISFSYISGLWEKQIQGQVFFEDGSYNVIAGRDWY